jgi:hypothetical protein
MLMANEIFLASLNEVVAKVKGGFECRLPAGNLQKRIFIFSLAVNEQILIWNFIWNNAPDFWTRIQAFFFCESLMKRPKELVLIWPIIKKMAGYG